MKKYTWSEENGNVYAIWDNETSTGSDSEPVALFSMPDLEAMYDSSEDSEEGIAMANKINNIVDGIDVDYLIMDKIVSELGGK